MAGIIFNAGQLKRFDILAYQIMPDHVHLLVYHHLRAHPSVGALHSKMGSAGTLQFYSGSTRDARARGKYNVSQLMHAIKSYYCDQIRDQYGINYPILQPRFYTRIVTTRKYLSIVIEYIKYNPVKADLLSKYYKLSYQFVNWRKIEKL